MPVMPDTLDSIDPALEIMPFNRRVSIRYPCGLATSTKVQIKRTGQFQRVQGFNISQGGMAVILDHPSEAGVQVYIRMKNKILNFTYDLSAQIVHVDVLNDGRWLVGMSFARPLTRSELASLL